MNLSTFFDNAFSSIQQELIKITNVKNDLASVGLSGGYICDDTNDEVFALSNQEIINYTGNSIHSSRIKHASSYATATGVPTSYNTIEEYEERVAEDGEEFGYSTVLEYIVYMGYSQEDAQSALDALVGGGVCGWLLRSAGNSEEFSVQSIGGGGYMGEATMNSKYGGLLPAMHISL